MSKPSWFSSSGLPFLHFGVYVPCIDHLGLFQRIGETPGQASWALIQKAKHVCLSCPVMLACQEHAVTTRETWGMWGGMTPEERARERTRRLSERAS